MREVRSMNNISITLTEREQDLLLLVLSNRVKILNDRLRNNNIKTEKANHILKEMNEITNIFCKLCSLDITEFYEK